MKFRKSLILIALCSLVYTIHCQSFSTILDSIESIRKDKRIPGLFVSIVSKDSVLHAVGFGESDLKSKEKVTINHSFKIGSVTKTFTALALMQLIEQDKLGLDDTLNEVAAELPFRNPWSDRKPILIKHLLEHKTGFDDLHFAQLAGEREEGITALDEVIACRKSMTSRWEPGLVHSYSNVNYNILAYLIEKISGMTYQEYIRKNILQPLEMNKTYFSSQRNEGDNTKWVVKGYRKQDDSALVEIDKKLIGEGAGALCSSARDMATFTHLFLNDRLAFKLFKRGPLVLEEMKELHSSFEVGNQITEGYGLGLYPIDAGSLQIQFLGHTGYIHGFSSAFIFSKEQNLGIAISNNLGFSNRAIINLLVDYFSDTTKVNQQAKEISFPKINHNEWEGHYLMINSRNKIADIFNYLGQSIKLESKNDSIVITPFLDQADTYYPISFNRFKSIKDASDEVYLTEFEGNKSVYFYEDLMMPVSIQSLWLKRILVLGSILLGLLSFVFSFFSLLWKSLRGKPKIAVKRTLLLSLPHLGFASMLLIFVLNTSISGLDKLGTISFSSLLIFLCSSAFVLLGIFGLYFLYKSWDKIPSLTTKFFCVSLVLSAWILIAYSWYFDWLFLRTWAF